MPEPILVQKIVEVDRDDLKRFTALFPGKGAWTEFVRCALKNLLKLHDGSFDESVTEAVKNIDAKELTAE